MPFANDNELIIAFRNADAEAYKIIFDRFYFSIVQFGFSCIKDKCHAQDIASNSFFKLYSRNKSFENIATIRAFLYVVTRNECLNYNSRERQKNKLFESLQDYHEGMVENNQSEAETAASLANEYIQLILRIVNKMKPQRRRVFLLYVEGKSTLQIAELLNIDTSTVRSHKRHAFDEIRSALVAA